jgi:hypothetical protein
VARVAELAGTSGRAGVAAAESARVSTPDGAAS